MAENAGGSHGSPAARLLQPIDTATLEVNEVSEPCNGSSKSGAAEDQVKGPAAKGLRFSLPTVALRTGRCQMAQLPVVSPFTCFVLRREPGGGPAGVK